MISLETLVNEGKFKDAVELCNSAIASGQDNVFWKTQLAYTCFLNDGDDEAQYTTAPMLFKSLNELNPYDANAPFWMGYLNLILFNDSESSRVHLLRAKAIEPKLVYSDLVLAGFPDIQGDTKIEYFEAVLGQKPNLYRGLIEISDLFIQIGLYEKARRTLNKLLNSDPYIESNYGVMNTYINDVLTGATHKAYLKYQAEFKLNALS